MSDSNLDEHGQLKNVFISKPRLIDRQIDELIGICKGVLADGAFLKEEADFMLRWIETNRSVANQWPANILYGRLRAAVQDGVIDSEEEKDLLETLLAVTGGVVDPALRREQSTQLPLDDPQPQIEFNGRLFCVTGRFISGPRDKIVSLINQMGGKYKNNVIKKTDYLVIGELSSRDWIHSSFGRKIEKALEIRESGSSVKILSEEHLINSSR